MTEFNPVAPVAAVFFEYGLWIIPLVIGLAALRVLLLPRVKGGIGEAMVGKALDRLFDELLHDIIVPDGRGGLTQIDHVALTSRGLLVIETKNYKGAIYGTARDAKWTQRLGGRSYRFQNPLRQNYLHISALEALELGLPVFGRVVFTDDSMFTKGVPEGVSYL